MLHLQVECIKGLEKFYTVTEINNWVSYLQKEGPERYQKYESRLIYGDGALCAFVSWLQKEKEEAAIECLYSQAKFRGKGYGATLLRAAEQLMTPGSIVTVRSTINARSFYEHHGYVYRGDAISRAGFKIVLLDKQL